MSTSMYEVFNWGYSNEDRPNKRFSLAIAGSEINIGEPPTPSSVPNKNRNSQYYVSNNNNKKGEVSKHILLTQNFFSENTFECFIFFVCFHSIYLCM